MKPRLLPSVTIGLAILLGAALFHLSGLRPDDGDGPSFAISGRAIARGESGLPGDVWVRISWEEGTGVRAVQVPVQRDGTFQAKKLKPGDYRIEAVLNGSVGGSSQGTPAWVSIRDRDVTGVEIRL